MLEMSMGTVDELVTSGDILPSVSAFSVEELTGAASINIPIDVPAGLGGLRPNLAFRYSSATVDDMYNQGDSDVIKVQASEVGMGWSLSGIPYIAGEFSGTAGRYSLVLDGLSSTILYNNNEWRTRPAQFVRIEWEAHNVPSEGADGIGRWIVTDKEGTQYVFGDDNATQWQSYGTNAGSAIAVFRVRSESGEGNRWRAKRWYLRRIVDASGNEMEFGYRTERGTETRFDLTPTAPGDEWYTSMISPREIKWNKYDNGYRMRVLFAYEDSFRYDTNIEGRNDDDGIQPWYGRSNQLEHVKVEVWERGAWRAIRSYAPVYFAQATNSVTNKRLMLKQLQVNGARGSILQTYRFEDYAFINVNQVYINVAENGFGGRVRYVLRHSPVNCNSSNCNRTSAWSRRSPMTAWATRLSPTTSTGMMGMAPKRASATMPSSSMKAAFLALTRSRLFFMSRIRAQCWMAAVALRRQTRIATTAMIPLAAL